jgi:AcrR family transcriptional regulator
MAPRHKESEREDVRSETRQRLLEAATEEFAREGYAGANVDRISKAAGFAKGTIYNYFDSKRALMLALIESFASAHLDFMAAQVLQEDDPARRLEVFFEAGFAFVKDYLALGKVIIQVLHGPDAAFKQALYAAYQPMFQLVGRDILAAGIEQGLFRPVEPGATAGLLMNIYLGIASQADEEGRPWITAGQVADFALNALLKEKSR